MLQRMNEFVRRLAFQALTVSLEWVQTAKKHGKTVEFEA